jgi:hypothetical protein
MKGGGTEKEIESAFHEIRCEAFRGNNKREHLLRGYIKTQCFYMEKKIDWMGRDAVTNTPT